MKILKLMINIKSNKNLKTPWIICHRGYHAKYPENTLAAFEAAIEAGADMIELDVMLSNDRKLVVIHDAILDRTSNGKGSVANLTLAELKQLDAGSWFDTKFADQQIPELSEVLDLVNGRAYVNIEIKSNAYEPGHPTDAIEKQVVDLLRQKDLLATSMVSSFDVNILEQIAFMENPPATAFISHKPADKKNSSHVYPLKGIFLASGPSGSDAQPGGTNACSRHKSVSVQGRYVRRFC